MSNTLRTSMMHKVAALAVAPFLLGTMSAAGPQVKAVHGQLDHKQTFYSDITKTVQVGYTLVYCDGDFVTSGYQTAYYTFYNYMPPCP